MGFLRNTFPSPVHVQDDCPQGEFMDYGEPEQGKEGNSSSGAADVGSRCWAAEGSGEILH